MPAVLVPSGLEGGLSSHTCLCHGGDLPEQSLLQSLSVLCLVGQPVALQPESGQGGQTAPAEGWGQCGVWRGKGSPAVGLVLVPVGLVLVGWGSDCQLNC